jgi:hypothetical protein
LAEKCRHPVSKTRSSDLAYAELMGFTFRLMLELWLRAKMTPLMLPILKLLPYKISSV